MAAFRILSLSGGGIRGIFQAVYLREIVKLLKLPDGGSLRQRFDLIAGTSTGAIIALGIALDRPLDQIVQLFESEGQGIFPRRARWWRRQAASWLGSGGYYSNKPLRDALERTFQIEREGSSKPAKLKDCQPDVMITATTLDRFAIRTFTNFKRCGNFPDAGKKVAAGEKVAAGDRSPGEDIAREGIAADMGLSATDVALASAAAPSFFPGFKPASEYRYYVDGGMWANTPALYAIATVLRYKPEIPLSDLHVISIGNGEVATGEVGRNFNKMRRVQMLQPILDMMFATQSELADTLVPRLLSDYEEERTLNANVRLKDIIALDDVDKAIDELKGRAQEKARDDAAKFARLISGKNSC